jgi:transcriptional regulator with XRE-family HTH domain
MHADMADLKEIGAEIRHLRLKRGYTLRDLAARAGVSFQYVSAIETGTQERPTLPTLEQVVRALGAELDVHVVDLANCSPALSGDDQILLARIAELLPSTPQDAKVVVLRTLEMLALNNKALTA